MREKPRTRSSAAVLLSGLCLAGALTAAPVAPAQDRVIRSQNGLITAVGPLTTEAVGVGGLQALFGEATTVRQDGNACRVRFSAFTITVTLANFGAGDSCREGRVQVATVDGRAWQTQRGLRVGDRTGRIARLYPNARFRRGKWELQQARLFGTRTPTLFAFVRRHRVRQLQAFLGGAGD